MGTELVASGEVPVFVKKQGTDTMVPSLTETDVRERAWRTCDVGSASCGFAGIEMEVRNDGSGIADVDAYCQSAEACQMSDLTLQGGLDRLSA